MFPNNHTKRTGMNPPEVDNLIAYFKQIETVNDSVYTGVRYRGVYISGTILRFIQYLSSVILQKPCVTKYKPNRVIGMGAFAIGLNAEPYAVKIISNPKEILRITNTTEYMRNIDPDYYNSIINFCQYIHRQDPRDYSRKYWKRLVVDTVSAHLLLFDYINDRINKNHTETTSSPQGYNSSYHGYNTDVDKSGSNGNTALYLFYRYVEENILNIDMKLIKEAISQSLHLDPTVSSGVTDHDPVRDTTNDNPVVLEDVAVKSNQMLRLFLQVFTNPKSRELLEYYIKQTIFTPMTTPDHIQNVTRHHNPKHTGLEILKTAPLPFYSSLNDLHHLLRWCSSHIIQQYRLTLLPSESSKSEGLNNGTSLLYNSRRNAHLKETITLSNIEAQQTKVPTAIFYSRMSEYPWGFTMMAKQPDEFSILIKDYLIFVIVNTIYSATKHQILFVDSKSDNIIMFPKEQTPKDREFEVELDFKDNSGKVSRLSFNYGHPTLRFKVIDYSLFQKIDNVDKRWYNEIHYMILYIRRDIKHYAMLHKDKRDTLKGLVYLNFFLNKILSFCPKCSKNETEHHQCKIQLDPDFIISEMLTNKYFSDVHFRFETVQEDIGSFEYTNIQVSDQETQYDSSMLQSLNHSQSQSQTHSQSQTGYNVCRPFAPSMSLFVHDYYKRLKDESSFS